MAKTLNMQDELNKAHFDVQVVPFVWVRACCSGHLNVVAAKEEKHDVTGQTEDVKEDDQLGGAFRFQLKPFEDVATQENAYASAGDGDAAGEHAGHALGQVELRF